MNAPIMISQLRERELGGVGARIGRGPNRGQLAARGAPESHAFADGSQQNHSARAVPTPVQPVGGLEAAQ
jgi:hypothetical protein